MSGDFYHIRPYPYPSTHVQRGVDLQAASAQWTTSMLRLDVNQTGETVAPFTFSTPFSEEPVITCGFVVDASQLKSGRWPMISAYVVGWVTRDRFPLSSIYTGARIGIVSEGPAGTKFSVNVVAQGPAFSGPME